MARAALMLVSLLLVALAGCSSDEPGPNGPVAPQVATDADGPRYANGTLAPSSLNYTDCSEQIGVFPVPMAAFEGSLPPGFTPAPFDEAGQLGSVAAVTYTCLVDGQPVSEFNAGINVVAPAEYAAADARLTILVGTVLTTRPESVVLYQAWGAGDLIFEGDVAVELAAPANPATRVGRASAELEGVQVTMTSTVPLPGGAAETAGFARLVYADGAGSVTGLVDFHWSASSSGSNTGVAVIDIDGMPAIPGIEAGQGIAFHYWGAYDYVAQYVPLPSA